MLEMFGQFLFGMSLGVPVLKVCDIPSGFKI